MTVTWDKIKSIRSSQQFAVIQQGQHITRKTPDAEVVQGKVEVQDDLVKVAPATGAPKEIPVKSAQYMIDEDTYGKEIKRSPGFLYGWNGAVTAGATLVQATQNSRNFTGQAALVRTIPSVAWLDPRTRTTVDFNAAYGSITQPGTVGNKTKYHRGRCGAGLVLLTRFYFLVDAAFIHDYSQGLSLQQSYGGGLGTPSSRPRSSSWM